MLIRSSKNRVLNWYEEAETYYGRRGRTVRLDDEVIRGIDTRLMRHYSSQMIDTDLIARELCYHPFCLYGFDVGSEGKEFMYDFNGKLTPIIPNWAAVAESARRFIKDLTTKN